MAETLCTWCGVRVPSHRYREHRLAHQGVFQYCIPFDKPHMGEVVTKTTFYDSIRSDKKIKLNRH